MCPTTIPTQSSEDSTHAPERTESVFFVLPQNTSPELATFLASACSMTKNGDVSVFTCGTDWTGEDFREAFLRHAAARKPREDITVASFLPGNPAKMSQTLSRAAEDLCRFANTQPQSGYETAKDDYTLRIII